MASHAQKLEWWSDRICGQGLVEVEFMGRWPVRIQPEMAGAVEALQDALIGHGYRLPIDATGSYSCRKISGTDTWSLHAVPIAIDVDYPNNPVLSYALEPGFGTDPNCTITEEQVDAVSLIVNADGTPIWKWLGWRTPSADPMHFEIDVPPDKCEVAAVPVYRTVENVPSEAWAENVIDWGIDEAKIIVVTDSHTDDWNANVDYGTMWTIMKRYADNS